MSLSDAEVVEILLRDGCRGTTTKELAWELLAGFGGLIGLSSYDTAYLQRHGMGGAKAATLVTAFEIARPAGRWVSPGRRGAW